MSAWVDCEADQYAQRSVGWIRLVCHEMGGIQHITWKACWAFTLFAGPPACPSSRIESDKLGKVDWLSTALHP